MKTCTMCSETKELSEYHKGKRSLCKACACEQGRKYHAENRAANNAKSREWHQDNPEKAKVRRKKWYQDNTEKAIAYSAAYRKANPEKLSASSAAYKKANPEKINALTAKRKARKLQAIPAWFDKEGVNHIYKLAKAHNLVVDHLVPLQSNFVCGLHTADNLRCIHPLANSIKGNRHWPDMWEAQYGQ